MFALLSSSSFISSGGYLAIFVLCVAQSCCIPTSSELTMGFAGYLAATGKLDLAGAIAVGTAGETVGAYIAWVVGRTGGRGLVDRFGRYVLLTHTDLDRAEAWYGRHERSGVFIGRLLPVIRSFVALVAGVAEVPLLPFGVFTLLGSAIWLGAMAGIGYGVGSSYHRVVHVFSAAGYVLGVVAVIVIAIGFVHRLRAYRHHRDLDATRRPSSQARSPRDNPQRGRDLDATRRRPGPERSPGHDPQRSLDLDAARRPSSQEPRADDHSDRGRDRPRPR